VVVEFIEGVIPIGDFTGITGDVERFHNSICEQADALQPIGAAGFDSRFDALTAPIGE
jgi:hypothetical protein